MASKFGISKHLFFKVTLLPFLLFTCLVLVATFVRGQTYQINGNTLTTSENVQIRIGGSIKFVRPYNGMNNFTAIYNEIALRSSTRDHLPKGISGNQSGKEVKVRKFYEKKEDNGTTVYLIVGGGFINQAIDIETALVRGEVLVERPADTTLKTTSSFRFPWQRKTPPAVAVSPKMDSSKLASKISLGDSNVLNKVNLVNKDTLQKARINNTLLAPIPPSQPSVKSTLNGQNTLNTGQGNPNPTPIANSSVLTNSSFPVSSPALPTETEPAHSVSSLLTLHPPNESSAPNNSNPTKNSSGYDKYDKLKQLKELYDQGILNKDEFELEKKKILNN